MTSTARPREARTPHFYKKAWVRPRTASGWSTGRLAELNYPLGMGGPCNVNL